MNAHSPRRRRGQTWLPLLAVAIITGLASVGAWWYLSRSPALPSNQGQVIVEEFFGQLRQGKTDQAWQATAADFKSYLGREAFRAYVGKNPELKLPLQFQHHDPSTVTPLPEYVYQTAPNSAKAKAPRTVKVRLVQEADQWKVESLAIQ